MAGNYIVSGDVLDYTNTTGSALASGWSAAGFPVENLPALLHLWAVRLLWPVLFALAGALAGCQKPGT